MPMVAHLSLTRRRVFLSEIAVSACMFLLIGCESAPTSDAGPSAPIKADVINRLAAHRTASMDEALPYPWSRIEGILAGEPLMLVGYGSLLNTESAARSIPAENLDTIPVIAYGGIREFTYRMPDRVVERRGRPDNLAAVAALNVVPHSGTDAIFNGRLFSLPTAELDPLRERERGYDLVPISIVPFDDPNAEPQTAYALMVVEPGFRDEILSDELLPHPGYVETCRSGALEVSPEFAAFFDVTSFVITVDESTGARKRTPLSLYLNKLRE